MLGTNCAAKYEMYGMTTLGMSGEMGEDRGSGRPTQGQPGKGGILTWAGRVGQTKCYLQLPARDV